MPQHYIWGSSLIGWLVQAVQPPSELGDWVLEKPGSTAIKYVLKRVGKKKLLTKVEVIQFEKTTVCK